MGRAATGTTLILLGYTLASKGLLTGAPGDDPRFSASDPNAPPFSVRVGDEWHKIAGFSPLGDLIALGATVHHESKAEGGLSGSVGAGLQLVGEQPMLRTPADLVEAVTEPSKKGARFAGRLAGNIVPTVVSDVAGALDDKARARGSSFWNQIAYRIPGLRATLPEAKDFHGRPIEHRRTDIVDPTLTRSVREGVQATGEEGLSPAQVRHNQRVRDEKKRIVSLAEDAGLAPAQVERFRHAVNTRFQYAYFRPGDSRRAEDVERVFRERLAGADDYFLKRLETLKGKK